MSIRYRSNRIIALGLALVAALSATAIAQVYDHPNLFESDRGICERQIDLGGEPWGGQRERDPAGQQHAPGQDCGGR